MLYLSSFCLQLYLFWTLDWFLLYLYIILLSSAVSLLDFGLVFAVPFKHHSVFCCISSGLRTGFCCTFPSSFCLLLYLFWTLNWFAVPFHHHPFLCCISSELWIGFYFTFLSSSFPLLYLFWTLDWFFAVPLHHPSALCCISSGLWTGFCCTFT